MFVVNTDIRLEFFIVPYFIFLYDLIHFPLFIFLHRGPVKEREHIPAASLVAALVQ